MRIKLHNRSAAGALIMIFVVVSCVVVVGLGLAAGCKAKKAIQKKQERDQRMESNLLSQAHAEYRAQGGTSVADMIMSQTLLVREDQVDQIKVQWSTNLVDWNDGEYPNDAPAMFWRIVGPE